MDKVVDYCVVVDIEHSGYSEVDCKYRVITVDLAAAEVDFHEWADYLASLGYVFDGFHVGIIGVLLQWNRDDLGYDSEPERTLLRRRREARRRERQVALEQQLNMAAEHNDDNLNLENNQNRVRLEQYINPTVDSCGSTIRRPAIQANNFELKPSLIQL
ncbi:hypothetical protein PIB30_049898, partial [Stylosanthes scabra]|nr:hypothetical protein [Stylosanthes scabra]